MNPVVEALSLLTPYDIDRPKIRVGPITDGGYILADCISNAQVVLSYGIGTEYRFDVEMARRGHDVFMFDHTIEGIRPKNKRLHFFREGIAGCTNAEDKVFSLKDHLDKHEVKGARLILKMDVEGAEYDVFETLPEEILDRFQQILLEAHCLDNLDELTFRDRFFQTFRRLNSDFTLFHVRANNCYGQNGLSIVGGIPISPILELSYIKSSLVRRRPSQTLYPTKLDYPNIKRIHDMLLWFYPFLPTSLAKESFTECAARVEHIRDRQTAPRWRRGVDLVLSKIGVVP